MTETITVSYSEIKDARRCGFKHDLAWRHGWRKTHRKECDCALCMGIAWHETLNAYYLGLNSDYPWDDFGMTWIDRNGQRRGAWHAAVHSIENTCPSHLKERIRWMLEGYAAHYGREAGWQVIAAEEQVIVPLPQVYDDLIVNLKAKIDLIIKDPYGKVWVDDHKTCATLPTERQQVDPQLPLYMYAVNEGTAWPIAFGARYSYARKPSKTFVEWPLNQRFRRRLVEHSTREVNEIARDAYISVYTRYNEAKLFKQGPRVIGDDCSYRCDYASACLASRKGYKTTEFLRDQNFTSYRTDVKMPVENSCSGS